MNLRTARWGSGIFFLLFVLAVTWPGMLPFNRIRPLVLGLPFSMCWIALWVFLSFLVLLLLDRVEEGARRTDRVEEGARRREEGARRREEGARRRNEGTRRRDERVAREISGEQAVKEETD